MPAVQEVNLDSRPVHSVPLLVAAELGVPGAVLWMCVVVAGLWLGGRAAMESRPAALAAWLAMVVVGLFDVSLWMTASWRAAMLFAMLAAHVSWPE